jgi:hypothetical protein
MSAPQILFDPFPKQIEFLELALGNKAELVLYGGAIRGGKTFAGLGALILLCKMYPGSRWAVVRKDLPTIKRNTVPSFKKVVPSAFCKGGSLEKAYNESDQVVTFTNGSQIIFFAENYDKDKELNRWKGLEVNGFLLEECNELNELSFYKAIERAGTYIIPDLSKEEQPAHKILMTCNPAQNWVKKLIYDPAQRGALPPGWHYIQARIFDNPYMSERYIKGLKKLPKNQYQVFVLGNWSIKLKSGAEFYHKFDLDRNSAPTKYNRELPLHVSFDENVNPYLPCTIWQGDGLKVWLVDEIALKKPKNKIKAVCEEIERRYKFHNAGMFIYGDSTSAKDDTKVEAGYNFFKLARRYLQRFKPTLRVPKSNPSVVMRGNFINALFAGEVEHCSVEIGEHCELTIGDLSNVLEASDGKKLKLKEKDPKTGVTFEPWGHLSDSLDYFLIWYFKSQYRSYQGGATEDKPRKIAKRRIIKSY